MTRSFVCLLLLTLGTPVTRGQDEEGEPTPGLRARYVVGTTAIERIDPDLAFVWEQDRPDERLPTGRFRARWTGTLLVQSGEGLQFHAYVQGAVRVKLRDDVLLAGNATTPRWISGPVGQVPLAELPLDVEFEQTADRAELKLYWSGSEFPLEPVPAHVFFLDAPAASLDRDDQGRRHLEAFRCLACHRAPESVASPSRVLAAPSLKFVGSGTRHEWLVQQLMEGHANGDPADPQRRMPEFGFSRDDAESIVAALTQSASKADWLTAPVPRANDVARDRAAGETLIRSLGCLACHSQGNLGEHGLYGGGALDRVAAKRSFEWVMTWLADPARINSRHRMPVFTLSDKERLQVGIALSFPIPPPEGMGNRQGDADRGRRLIAASRCGACHELPGAAVSWSPVAALSAQSDWNRGCSQPPDGVRYRPRFAKADFEGIRGYLESSAAAGARGETTGVSRFMIGRRILEQKNCLQCHDRDTDRGLSQQAAAIARADESLAGLHMTLIPPRLTAVGDRMHDAGLAEAIQGRQKSPRLNWLRVRMPRFVHTPEEQAALLAYLIGHDRIPGEAPSQRPTPPESANPAEQAQRLIAGRELLGGKGFSCVACHAIRDYTPRVTALGTRGSNLFAIGERLRQEYFLRWMRAPLRVMPGVEMPNYQRPHEFILPGNLELQLAAIWEALNDPQLTVPTNPAVVEQWLAVGPHEAPRVVRDVFTVPARSEVTIARSYAMGLPGGHSLLLDLETGSVRGWTLGDFARQRCEGKRWFWDLAGIPLATDFPSGQELVLVDAKNEVLAPETDWEAQWTFRDETRGTDFVSLRCDVALSRGSQTLPLTVTQTFTASATGLVRKLEVQCPAGTRPWLREPRPRRMHDQAAIVTQGGAAQRLEGLEDLAIPFDPATPASLTIDYSTALRWENPPPVVARPPVSSADAIITVPGFAGRRLPISRAIMPTSLAWDNQRNLVFTSLKGHVYRLDPARPESLMQIEEGLAAPFGIIESREPSGTNRPDLIVAHKPELLRLHLDSAGRVLDRSVLATGWGVTDDYHDWTCGIARDSAGALYVGLGSDYTFKNRPANRSRWRGDILKIDPRGTVESIARGLRYPIGLAIDDQDHLFCSDQQGVQNTFNELNWIQPGHRYGVPSRHDPDPEASADVPAVQIPHPWTRSVNGIAWVPRSVPSLAPWAGQFVGCEFNNHFLIRCSIQEVDGQLQGGVYPFSRPTTEGEPGFLGPICAGIGPRGEIVVGGLQDGGWAGGLNLGDLVVLTPAGTVPNGIREIRATSGGLAIEFFHPVDSGKAREGRHYQISGFTRVWKGDYATADSGRHSVEVSGVELGSDRRRVMLNLNGLRAGSIYDVSVGNIGTEAGALWPAVGHYTLHRIPREGTGQ